MKKSDLAARVLDGRLTMVVGALKQDDRTPFHNQTAIAMASARLVMLR